VAIYSFKWEKDSINLNLFLNVRCRLGRMFETVNRLIRPLCAALAKPISCSDQADSSVSMNLSERNASYNFGETGWRCYDLIAVPLTEVGAEFLFQLVVERAERGEY
jgi:hypothetical protein